MTTASSRYPNVFDAGLPTVEYQHLTDPDEAHARIARARRQTPIALGPYGPEVLHYELVHTVLCDPRFAMPRGLGLDAQGITSGSLWHRASTNILSLDGDAHHRLRRLVAKAFSPRATARLQSLISTTITELVSALAEAGGGDVVSDVSRRYPTPIICALLGAPPQDWHLFTAWSDDIMKIFDWNVADDEPVITAAWDQLDAYLDHMVAHRRNTLTDDLISELIRAEDDGDRLTRDELLMLAGALLAAGTDTTRNQLAAAIQCLCDHPEQWALLARQPELAPQAVEELIRYYPVSFGTIRSATEDVELADVTIPAGTLVVANTAAANRDSGVFDKPDQLDITRRGVAPVLTFGGGTHYCLGSHLARLELTAALQVFTSRFTALHRTGPAPWKAITGVTGPVTLPVATQCAGLISRSD
ncbi:cytochrome P450 [Mycolicibacterium komossense]|uniref:Cytochrome P450 n=1 Tax=Mycolicibacterium komossense TaxID=1779 RepID=A0ABT3CEZ1_9MYCO|nr:cytochrome P450 [Mycolicibacterium komossense]MCV7228062.1 cytochrome P450 [Mycolicibacterium komossense]